MQFFKSSATLSDKHAFIILSILMSFSSAQVSLNTYIDSLYLTSAIENTPSLSALKIWEDPSSMVGALYTLGSIITLLTFFIVPRVLRRFGNYRWTLGIMLGQVVTLLGLALFDTAWLIIPLFILQTTLVAILYFNFDIFIERYSKDEYTGIFRGILKALTSLAWLLPPFIAGMIVDRFGFPLVYFSGAMILLPAILLMMRYLHDFKDMHYEKAPMFLDPNVRINKPDIPRIYWVNFFLQFFFAWMIIYAPIYFHNVIGLSYEEFGMILTLALTAFVILPTPEGILADRILGEKEMLVLGFLLMGLTSFAIPYLAGLGVALWAWGALLFLGRMGAATVEVMSEVYFFKQIDGRNSSLIGYFRRARPSAYIVAPMLASLLLGFELIEFGQLFTILGFIMLGAIYFPLRIKDTR